MTSQQFRVAHRHHADLGSNGMRIAVSKRANVLLGFRDIRLGLCSFFRISEGKRRLNETAFGFVEVVVRVSMSGKRPSFTGQSGD